jgi:hypothetical protein
MDKANAPGSGVGGGIKKILYSLEKVGAIGVAKATKALLSNNTCKTCGLGVGGQLGGMTNKSGKFPSVCNKSVQTRSTDIEPAIPDPIFNHSPDELMELSERERASLGRLNTPPGKPMKVTVSSPSPGNKQWPRFREVDANLSFSYSSGRSSNGIGLLLQLFAAKVSSTPSCMKMSIAAQGPAGT